MIPNPGRLIKIMTAGIFLRKTYQVHLTGDEEKQLKDIISKGVHPARQVTRAPHIALIA
jgi:hypothetical protein